VLPPITKVLLHFASKMLVVCCKKAFLRVSFLLREYKKWIFCSQHFCKAQVFFKKKKEAQFCKILKVFFLRTFYCIKCYCWSSCFYKKVFFINVNITKKDYTFYLQKCLFASVKCSLTFCKVKCRMH